MFKDQDVIYFSFQTISWDLLSKHVSHFRLGSHIRHKIAIF